MIERADVDPAEISRIADQIPVRVSMTMEVEGYAERASEILKLFDIHAAPLRGGIEFDPGVEPGDQALVEAVTNLVARRFGRPEQR
ncbi:hypothetical protein [Microbacterium sp. SSM24]|uniref:hypothetical protein n=1 Tax=Microbacterium sp. SSM24 TaxID=2991714 RepID=UPI002227D44B|nr:hypothetical protein [Microbacterium sp. SSM24]MCW3492549.1 hypothetical protein [Microbacterium sp. SSM24]